MYVLRCADGTLYTGITTDLERRLRMHGSGRGARYTRGRGPFAVVYTEAGLDHGAALRREAVIRRRRPEWKRALAASRRP